MYYEILINGEPLGVFGHDAVRNMHLSLQVVDDSQDVFASAVCEESGELWFYDWLQQPVEINDRVEFRRVAAGPSQEPQRKRRMERKSVEPSSPPPNTSLERTREG
jgi:hypothetical protein